AQRARPPHPERGLPPGTQAAAALEAGLPAMNWLSRIIAGRGDAGPLPADLAETLRSWRALPEPDLGRAHFETRYAVVNTEASGLDLDTDRLLAVGGL